MRIAAFLNLEIEHGRGILRGIARQLRSRPNLTILKFSQTGGYRPDKLRALRLDGIIARVASERDARILRDTGVPVVNVAGQIATPGTLLVSSDDRLVGRLAARHLLGRGYRHLAYCGMARHLGSLRRSEGFATEAGGMEPAVKPAVFDLPTGDQTAPYSERFRQRLERWIARLPKPAGILGFTDRIALEVDEACTRLGLNVPEEVAIMGVGNDLTRIEFAHTELTSVQLNTQRIGELAAEHLLDAVDRRARPAGEILVSPLKIVVRASTDRFAIADEAVHLALDHIREHIGNAIYVDEVAAAAGVSRRALEMRFRRALGESVNRTIQRLHLERAIELMADPRPTHAEIADACGFGSAAGYSTLFRRRYGQSPAQFRARLLGRPEPAPPK